MRRNNGYTLVEVIAAVTIFGILITVVGTVLFSLYQVRDQAENKRIDQHDRNMTLNTLSTIITDSAKAAYRELSAGSVKELRVKTGNPDGGYMYRVFRYESDSRTLILFRLNGANDTNFSNSGTLAVPLVLSDAIDSFHVSYEGSSSGAVLADGKSIQIAVGFEQTNGQVETLSTTYKLLKEE